MENFFRRYLLQLARKYAKAEGLTISTVSRRMHGAAHFLEGFERGEISVTLSKYDEMLQRSDREWPDGAAWPVARGTVNLRRKYCVKNQG